MLIDEKKLSYWIDNFYGYGSWGAKIWFVGYEETGGDLPEEVAEKLDCFYGVHSSPGSPTLCDIREIYKHLTFRIEGPKADRFTTLYDYRFGRNALQHGLWKNLIAFAGGFRDSKISDLVHYQQSSFISPSEKNEALIQLYPLPSPHAHAWYYSWLDMPQLAFLKSRKLYEESVYQNRVGVILENIRIHKPEIVLMYAMNNINLLKKSFENLFPSVKFKMVKGTKLLIPQHHIADLSGTIIVMTTQIPTLRHNRIETGFDWELFGKGVRSQA